LALRPLEVDRPPDKAGGGDTRWPPALHTEHRKHTEMARHRAEPFRTPREWRLRALKNKWYGFIKPDLRRRYRALQGFIEQNLENFAKKLR
jgi:hypothetical protein